MPDLQTIADRIKYYRDFKGFKKSQFERLCGLSNGYLNSTSTPGANKLEDILRVCKDLNRAWLFSGEGNMLLPDLNNASSKDNLDFMAVPLIPIRGKAGYLTGYGDMEYIENLPTIPVIIDRSYKGKYRCFEVDGDSMDDGTRQAVCDKDIVLGRDVKKELWRSKLHIKDWNFIIVHTEGITIKRISEHDVNRGIIKCHSLNPLYDDFELHLDNVFELYNLIKTIDRSGKL